MNKREYQIAARKFASSLSLMLEDYEKQIEHSMDNIEEELLIKFSKDLFILMREFDSLFWEIDD